jgi:hypothetical protein
VASPDGQRVASGGGAPFALRVAVPSLASGGGGGHRFASPVGSLSGGKLASEGVRRPLAK